MGHGAMSGITINKTSLNVAILLLSTIKNNSKYAVINTDNIFSKSESKTGDSLKEVYNILKEIDITLDNLITETISTMGAAIEGFTEAEKAAIKLYLDI